MTDYEALLRTIWLKPMASPEGVFELTLASKSEAFKVRSQLYAFRKKVLQAGDDPDLLAACGECEIVSLSTPNVLTIRRMAAAPLAMRLAEQLGVTAEQAVEGQAEDAIARLLAEVETPKAAPIESSTPYYTRKEV